MWVVHGVSAFDKACAAVWGRAVWAIVLLVPASLVLDADDMPVPEVVSKSNSSKIYNLHKSYFHILLNFHNYKNV